MFTSSEKSRKFVVESRVRIVRGGLDSTPVILLTPPIKLSFCTMGLAITILTGGNTFAVAEWYGAGLEVVGSTPARGCCVPTPTQHAIPTGSVNE